MTNNNSQMHVVGYGTYVFIWLTLCGLTALTATVSGIYFGAVTLLIALIIAITKASLVLNIFMHIKFDHFLFRVFITLGIFTLLSIFVLTYSDYIFR
jgi:cytochrome c oxidase subunit 4